MTVSTTDMTTGTPTPPPSFEEDVTRRSPRLQRSTRVWWTVLRRPVAAVSLGYLVVLVLGAILAPLLAPYSPTAADFQSVLSGPTKAHMFGTDILGRDVLSRLMYGGRVSLVNAAVAVATVLGVAVTSGVTAGFFGGKVDRVFTWIVDIIIALPALILLLLVLATFGNNMTVAMVALGILISPGLARIVRGVTLAERHELYVAAARASGLPSRYIVFRHVLPRVAGPIIVSTSLIAGAVLVIDAGLAYLGFGAQPPTPTWGGMISDAANVLSRQPWLLVPPGVILGLASLAFGLLGDAVRDATTASVSTSRISTRRRSVRVRPQSPTIRAVPSQVLLSVRDVSIALRTADGLTSVVEDLSLDINAGETVGLVGESGCGKTITARAILGMLPSGGVVTGGSIQFDGAELVGAGRKEMRRLRGSQLALISQEPVAALDPVFSAGQQVGELVRRHHGGSRSDVRTRTLELLDGVKLPDPQRVARSYPHELSGGMAQRVGIAMALAGEPRLLIADEPTTALDVTIQEEILDLLRDLQRDRGMAILLVSHNWGVVADMCERAYVMYAGHVMESCSVLDMFDEPMHPYTVGLLASTPRRSRRGDRLPAIPGTVPNPQAWPTGCHFAPRCPLATADCSKGPIPIVQPSEGHRTRCIHHDQLGVGGGHD